MNSKFLKSVRIAIVVCLTALYSIAFINFILNDYYSYGWLFIASRLIYLISAVLFVIIFMAIEQILRNTENIMEYIQNHESEDFKSSTKSNLRISGESNNQDFWYCECGCKNLETSTSCKGCGKQKK